MKTRRSATIEDLMRCEQKAELVDGEVVPMSPTGRAPNVAAGIIFVSLFTYAQRTGSGQAYTDNMAFVVSGAKRRSFSPDVAFDTEKLDSLDMKFATGAPIFAVEVRSEGDYGPAADKALAAKRADYFAAGTLVVWDVDLLGADTIRVYRTASPDEPTVYHRSEVAEAEPALPGWTFAVDDLFPRSEAS